MQVLKLTTERREALLRSKRLRREPDDQHGAAAVLGTAGATDAVHGHDPVAQVQQAVAALQQERRVGSPSHLKALRQLRRSLSTGAIAFQDCKHVFRRST